ncbi:hypothetical protein LAWI1_G007195 [Lachnellula willkommii]|uniref:Uncharacterized protein n=1 Tax=Lachnellula willkommii TaxID=215461 RepID=A0A559LZP6_9HELO|nr:hypothetical protein LAWI1_G007195 [Lachnellula willkommii]
MHPPPNPTLLILGGAGTGTGTQNSAVRRQNLLRRRNPAHLHAHALRARLRPGAPRKHHAHRRRLLRRRGPGLELCFVNTNGFAVGEKNGGYWGVRMYELARLGGVRHFVWRIPFVDGKGEVARELMF